MQFSHNIPPHLLCLIRLRCIVHHGRHESAEEGYVEASFIINDGFFKAFRQSLLFVPTFAAFVAIVPLNDTSRAEPSASAGSGTLFVRIVPYDHECSIDSPTTNIGCDGICLYTSPCQPSTPRHAIVTATTRRPDCRGHRKPPSNPSESLGNRYNFPPYHAFKINTNVEIVEDSWKINFRKRRPTT